MISDCITVLRSDDRIKYSITLRSHASAAGLTAGLLPHNWYPRFRQALAAPTNTSSSLTSNCSTYLLLLTAYLSNSLHLHQFLCPCIPGSQHPLLICTKFLRPVIPCDCGLPNGV